MRKLFAILVIGVLFISSTPPDKSIFNKAKILVFDENWESALTLLNKIEKDYPNSNYLSMSYFYKGKCNEELKNEEKAIKNFEMFLINSDNDSLAEEAEISIINNAFKLYKKGKKKYLKKITGRLSSFNKSVKYYSAFSLSYAKDKTVANKSLAILKKIIFEEEDSDLIERAKLAILRINPKELAKINKNKTNSGKHSKMLRIRVIDKKTNKAKVTVNIPFTLAELAIKSLPDSEKKALVDKGYDLNTILKILSEVGEIIRIDDENELIKIWIE